MKLDADPTVIYPVTKGKPLGRRILRSELNAANGYNTYRRPGLPEGPIANPGKASIEAVLHPAQTQALYFVADGTGGHVFAENYDQHLRNVAKLRQVEQDEKNTAAAPVGDGQQPVTRGPATAPATTPAVVPSAPRRANNKK